MACRIRLDSSWIPPPDEGPPKVALAGPGWAGSGMFWSPRWCRVCWVVLF